MRRLRETRLPLLALALLAVVPLKAGDGAGDPAAFAARELESLQRYDGTPRSMSQLLERNLQDYFALYQTPTDPGELSRLVRTTESIATEFLGVLLSRAQQERSKERSGPVETGDVDAAARSLLPVRRDESDDFVFFPEAPPESRVAVEPVDLEALRDTGLIWRAMEAGGAGGVPVAGSALGRVAEVVGSYTMVVLRLAGEKARDDYAPLLMSPHLRAAVKEVAARRAARAAPVSPDPGAPATPFVDVTDSSGVDFRHRTSEWLSRFRRYGGRYPTFSGGGVTAVDADGDDWPDLVFCGGEGCSLFLNRKGRFEDVTAAAGLRHPGEARMALVADLDNDGVRDLFLTYARDGNRVYQGIGGGRFVDRTDGSGLAPPGEISGAAVTFDFDGDGLLDVFVANFGDYMSSASPWLTKNAQNGMPSRLYRNEGAFRFRDVTREAGIAETGWAQAVSHVDYDDDGDQDLYIANDFGRNSLLENLGNGTFAPRGRETFTDNPFHGMNVAFSDLNGDLHPDIFITNIWTLNAARQTVTESNSLLLSRVVEGDVRYRPGQRAELNRVDTGWSWGALFFDADNDGDDDLYCVNGLSPYFTFSQQRPHPARPDRTYPKNYDRDPNLFYWNEDGSLRLVDPRAPGGARSGAELGGENSRSVALLDFDRDGDLDFAVSTFHSRAHLFRNDAPPTGNHWLVVELVGDPSRRTPRDAIGSRVIARGANGLQVWRSIQGGEGYLSMSSLPLEFGLGPADRVDLEVHWAGGETQRFAGVAADRRVRIVEGRDDVVELEP